MAEPVPADAQRLADLIGGGELQAAFQPIVDLDSGAAVGYEALTRGPAGHRLARPDQLFAAARAADCLAELDDACWTAALEGARAAELAAPWTLFVNLEPESAALAVRGDHAPHPSSPRIVVELTERRLTAQPVELLRLVERVRERGWGVAVDDVGAERASLALLPLLRPDVIKLDLRLVQQQPSRDIAEIFSAVNAEAERSGALILAEGIELPEHLDVARALGAHLGQGWLLGRPGTLPTRPAPPAARTIPVIDRAAHPLEDAPFALLARAIPPRIAGKALLIEISKHLEREAVNVGETVVVVTALQHVRFFTPSTKVRYARLSEVAAFVAILGEDVPPDPMPGVRGGSLAPDDPVVGEWGIAVVGPHFAATLVARDLGDDGPDEDRRFEFVLSHDRDLVIAVAAALMARVVRD